MSILQRQKQLPLVSILTPAFNSERFIRQTVESVKGQNYPFIEHFILDGSSKDNTLKIVSEVNAKAKIISEPDTGQSNALNKGIKLSQGEIIGWLNSDDLYLENIISNSVNYLLSNPGVAAVYSDGIVTDANNRHIADLKSKEFSLSALILGDYYISQPTIFIRRKQLEFIGGLDENLHFTMDYDLWLRMGLKYQIGYLPIQGAAFRIHTDSKTFAQVLKFHDDRIYTLNKFFNFLETENNLRQLQNLAFANAYIQASSERYTAMAFEEAKNFLREAVKYYPEYINNEVDNLALKLVSGIPIYGEKQETIIKVSQNLPSEFEGLELKKVIYKYSLLEKFYKNYQKKDFATIRQMIWKILRIDPSLIRNRGVLSIAIEAFVGTTITNIMRRFMN